MWSFLPTEDNYGRSDILMVVVIKIIVVWYIVTNISKKDTEVTTQHLIEKPAISLSKVL
jgi:hypothetical protein